MAESPRLGTRSLTHAERLDIDSLADAGQHKLYLALPMLRRLAPVTPAFRREELDAFRRAVRHGGEPPDPTLPVRLLRHLVDCLRAGTITVEEIEARRKTARFAGKLPFVVGAYWGERIALAAKHDWAMVSVDGEEEAAALLSPKRGAVIFPFAIVDRILRQERDNTLGLAYAGIVADPEEGTRPGSLQIIG
jgi:hypothetical protein